MRKRGIRFAASALALLMLSTLFMGCSGTNKNEPEKSAQSSGTTSTEVQSTGPVVTPETAEDSSDLPDWTGKQLKLTYWNGHGTGGNRIVPVASKDVVTPEIARVTGITLDEDNSFDNGGTEYNQKLALITAADEWPDLIWNSQDDDSLIKRDLVYDLTELIPKYCPNIVKKFPDQYAPTIWDSVDGGTVGKKYGVVFGLSPRFLSLIYPEYGQDEYDRLYFNDIDTFRQPVFIRDDILKQLYPDAKTTDDIKKTYVEKGSFTKEEIYDVPIASVDDFYAMLYKIRDMKLSEGKNQPIWPTFARSGQDNWALLAYFLPQMYGTDTNYSYYNYLDISDKKVKFSYADPLFKKMVSDINKLVKDGVMPKESMTDTQDQFNAKWKNGQYAVSYAWWSPNNDELKANGKPYQYRPVYFQTSIDRSKYPLFAALPTTVGHIAISKRAVKEEDLPQILKWLDYMVSDSGEKMLTWGPKSAGLFTEENGVRKLTDKEMEDEIVNNKPRDKFLEYGLFVMVNDTTKVESVLRPSFLWGAGRFNPDYVYKKASSVRKESDFLLKLNANLVDPYKDLIFARDAYSASFAVDQAPLMNDAWKKRNMLEDALMKCYTGLSDEKFEQAFANFQKVCKEQVGYNDAAEKEMNDWFFNVHNKDYPNAFK